MQAVFAPGGKLLACAPMLTEPAQPTPRSLWIAFGLGCLPVPLVLLGMAGGEVGRGGPAIWQSLDLALAGGALGVAFAIVFMGWPEWKLERVPVWVALLLAAAPSMVAGAVFDEPITNDERAYLFEAEAFADGRLSEDLAAAPGVLRRRQVFEDEQGGVRFAKYPFGTSAALTPGVALAWPRLVVLLTAVIDILLMVALARRFGLSGRLAGLLLAASPFFMLVHTSYQSQVFTLPAALCAWLALLKLRESERLAWRQALAIGAACGWVFCCRPLTGVVMSVALIPGFFLGRTAVVHGLREGALAVVGGLPFLALTLVFNQALTGEALTAPYELYARIFGPFDTQGQPVDVYPNGEFLPGLMRQLARWSPSLLGLLGAVGLGLQGLWRLRARDGGAGLSFAVLLPLAYSVHWYPGHWAYLGPLYNYEVLGLLTLGAVAVVPSLPRIWRTALPLAAVLAAVALFWSRFGLIHEHSLLRSAPQRAVSEDERAQAVVVLLPHFPNDPAATERSWKRYTPSLPSELSSAATVFVRELAHPDRTRAALQKLGLNDREVYRFVPDRQGLDGHLEVWQP